MFPSAAMSNSTNSLSEEATVSTGTIIQDFGCLNPIFSPISPPQHPQQPPPTQKIKKKRNQPGNPDPDAEVISLSPKTLLATNRFVCEICNKGFQRDQNLQLHRRGHNLPWKLKQRNSKETKKRVYVCPEPSCVHHHPTRALGDLTGIKKHYCRKHGEKKWKCEKCSKVYAVQSDWKAHSKTCGTKEYRCDCGTLFSRKDSFITHRAFCDALAEESARLLSLSASASPAHHHHHHHIFSSNPPLPPPPQTSSSASLFPLLTDHPSPTTWDPPPPPLNNNPSCNIQNPLLIIKPETETPPHNFQIPPQPPLQMVPIHHKGSFTASSFHSGLLPKATSPSPHLSATALLQKAASMGAAQTTARSHMMRTTQLDMGGLVGVDSVVVTDHDHGHDQDQQLGRVSTWQKRDRLTRDFLGLTADDHRRQRQGGCSVGQGKGVNVSMNAMDALTYAGGLGFQQYPNIIDRDNNNSMFKLPLGPLGFASRPPPPASQANWADLVDG